MFLKQTTSLESLRVGRHNRHCAIRQLFLEEEFDLHDQDVQDGLLKIEYISGFHSSVPECARLLKRLPNLKSLGTVPKLASLLYAYREDEEIVKKLSNFTEFCDQHTELSSLERFVKFCPKVKTICLYEPKKKLSEICGSFHLSRNYNYVRKIPISLMNSTTCYYK